MSALDAARIVAAVADAAERWRDADFPPRVRATRAVMERTGYSEPVVDFAFDALFGSITKDALRATIVSELGSLDALDDFVARPGRGSVTYRGVACATIVSSDTTVGVAIPPLAYALCAKTQRVVVKDRCDGLVAAFAETLAQEQPALGDRTSVERWEGYDDPTALDALGTSDTVVAFGGSAALRALRTSVAADAVFVPYGHRTSVAYVTRETVASSEAARAAADGIARDALLYDGEGCLSVHVAFVERDDDGAGDAFGAVLAHALDAAAVEFPRGREAASTARYASSVRFRAAQGEATLHASGVRGHVLAAASLDEPPPLLPRAVALYAVDGPAEALAYVRRHGLALEGFALDARTLRGETRADALAAAVASGAARLTTYGRLQTPPIWNEHGGVPRVLPFVRAVVRDAP
jgi:hypothetical protein